MIAPRPRGAEIAGRLLVGIIGLLLAGCFVAAPRVVAWLAAIGQP